jgi:hypothetical protein
VGQNKLECFSLHNFFHARPILFYLERQPTLGLGQQKCLNQIVFALSPKLLTTLKKKKWTNAPAYFAPLSVTNLTRAVIHSKLFSSVLTNWPNKLECWSPASTFQPSVMFVSNVRAYPREAAFRCSTLG